MQGSNIFLTTVPLGIRKVMIVPTLREPKSYTLDKCFYELPNYILTPKPFFSRSEVKKHYQEASSKKHQEALSKAGRDEYDDCIIR